MGSLQDQIEFIHPLTITRFATVASATILIWDAILTLDLEVSVLWSGKLSLGKILFMINRYPPIALVIFQIIYQFYPLPSNTVCKSGFLISGLGGVMAFGASQTLLIARIHALYRSKSILIALLLVWFHSIVMMVAIFLYLFIKFVVVLPTGELVPGCAVSCTHPLCRNLIKVYSVPFFGLETALFLLTVYKTYETCRLTGRGHVPYISKIITRDGLVYYIVIISMAIFNIILWWSGPVSLDDLGQSLMMSMQATICSRLFLNLREALSSQPRSTLELTKILESYEHRRRLSMEMGS